MTISGTTILINLIGGVALLLWGLWMVRIAVTDGWGNDVRRVLGKSLSNHYHAFFAGLGVTMLLQSSSAKALLISFSLKISFQLMGVANHQVLHLGMVDIFSIALNYLGKLFA